MMRARLFAGRLASMLVAGVLAASQPALAGQPVWDPEEIADLAQEAARMAEALSRATELLNDLNALTRTVGRFGTLSVPTPWRFDIVDALAGGFPDREGAGSGGGGQTVRSPNAAALGGTTRTTAAGAAKAAIDRLRRAALEDGYALAGHTRDMLGLSMDRARLLSQAASSAFDLRGDMAANTRVSLAVYEQLSSIHALFAAILEIRSLQRLATMPGTPPVAEQQSGGK
jgi:hypothetical protein